MEVHVNSLVAHYEIFPIATTWQSVNAVKPVLGGCSSRVLCSASFQQFVAHWALKRLRSARLEISRVRLWLVCSAGTGRLRSFCAGARYILLSRSPQGQHLLFPSICIFASSEGQFSSTIKDAGWVC